MTDEIERLKDSLPSLKEYVETDGNHTTELTREGEELRGSHPAHGSSTDTNFAVNPSEGKWFCHRAGHKTGGDILSWIAVDEELVDCPDADNIADVFPEVVERAAEIAGIDLDTKDAEEAKKRGKERERVRSAMEQATRYYESQLTDTVRDWVREKYGFTDEQIDEARIGYAPAGGEGLQRDTDIDQLDLLRTGLVIETSDGIKDFFDGRVVFPYIKHGRPVYMIGRKTPRTPDEDWEQGKYKKLRMSDSGNMISGYVDEPIFGIDSVSDEDEVIVTEGVTDALILHQYGYAAVAPVTTQFKKRRVDDVSKALRGKSATVVMDEDAESQAGLEGAVKTARHLAESGRVMDVEVGRLPSDGGDTDVVDFFKENGKVAFEGVLDGSVGIYEAKWRWGDGSPADLLAAGYEQIGHDPQCAFYEEDDDSVQISSVWELIGDESDPGKARVVLKRRENQLDDGKEHVQVYAEAVWRYLRSEGEFFQTSSGEVYYFFDVESKVYKVTTRGSDNVEPEFVGLIDEKWRLSPDSWGRTIFKKLAGRAVRAAPERAAHKIAYWDESEGVLYVNRFDNSYYVLDGETIDVRRNGTDVFFFDVDAEPYEYLPEGERAKIGGSVPGELDGWAGVGDYIHRFLTNRVNYSEKAALPPEYQRMQLYLHLHAIPFITMLDTRPIAAFVGNKGSGKTVIQRSIGQFIYGPDWRETMMPDDKDDFFAIVSNSPLAFIDNYDDGVDWANDALAAVATGATVQKREYFTTNDMAKFNPDCFISVTSRDPPFRRDDVADRTLVFRVSRLDEFIGTGPFLKQIDVYRDEIWSDFLDNLNKIVAELHDRSLADVTTSHRMADWAALAKVASDALGMGHVDDLLETMQVERAVFALEDDPLRIAISSWLKHSDKTEVGREYTASELHTKLKNHCKDQDINFSQYSRPQEVGKRLVAVQEELQELFDMRVNDDGHANKYRFGEDTEQFGLDGY